MHKFRTILAICLALVVFGSSRAGTVAVPLTDDKPREKIYLHVDKAFYMPGEIVWFKAYVVDAQTHKPMDISHVAYVEVLNHQNQRVMQTKVPLGAGETQSGSWFIPHELTSGRYQVVAYTTLMKQFGETAFFDTYIDIVNPIQEQSEPVERSSAEVLQLFPESGRFLDGIATNVGFKLADARGHGRTFQALVFEDDSVEVAHLHSNRFGMGSFQFTPYGNRQYTIRIIQDGQSEAIDVDFPQIENNGYVINVVRDGEKGFQLRVAGTSHHADKPLVLTASSNVGGTEMNWDIRLSPNAEASLFLSTDELPMGVVNVTLSEVNGTPVAERLIFRPGGIQFLDVKAELSAATAAQRAELALSVSVPADQMTDSPDLSVSVFQVDDLQQVPNGRMAAYLQLQSEVKGYIEDVDYYLSTGDPQVLDDLDVLLLTQAWRKIVPAGGERHIAEYKSHRISIRFTESATGQPITNEMSFLSIPETDGALYVATTDSVGVATFNVRNMYGTKQVIAQLASNRYMNYEADILSPFAGRPLRDVIANYSRQALTPDIVKKSVDAQAEHVFNRKERGIYQQVDGNLLPFFGSGDITYWLDDYTRFVLMEEVLREYVTEVNVRRSRNDYSFRILNKDNNVYFDGAPLILLDGIPLFSANEIIDYDPLQVEKIDIVTGRYYYGQGIFDGIVNFSTYDGHIEGFELDEKAKVFQYEGLQYEREFYVPQHGEGSSPRLPDFRNVLLWVPRLAIDEGGNATLRIATSDLSGRFAVVVQGVDNQGRIAHHLRYFNVN